MTTATSREANVLCLSPDTPRVRLDKYLAQAFPQFSRSYLKRLIQQGHILVNDGQAKPSQRLDNTDQITITLPAPVPEHHPLAEPAPLAILYEDSDVLVIDKPPGLVVHPGPGHPDHTLVNAVLAHCPSIVASDDLSRPGIVHRLDKDTSGLMVIAKNEHARKHLVSQFKTRTLTKAYLALVRGRLPNTHGVIEAAIGRDPHNRKRMALVPAGREASSRYAVRQYLGDHTLLDITPTTGRTHQLRVHLSSIGHSIVGDRLYGPKRSGRPPDLLIKRQFLHAYRLGFRLPSTDVYHEFTSPLPPDLEQILNFLRCEL
jgi:23S rRNA pseudouridine1911/1915/1917 synthase